MLPRLVGTTHQPCWLAEACIPLLPYVLLLHVCSRAVASLQGYTKLKTVLTNNASNQTVFNANAICLL